MSGSALPAPAAEALASGEVHVWVVRHDAHGSVRWQAVLDAAERCRAERYAFAADRRRFVATRTALRLILARYLGVDPAAIRFGADSRGRPFLTGPGEAAGLDFNVAHTDDIALIAVAAGQVGVDVELISPRLRAADIASRWFGGLDTRCIERGCGGSPLGGFYRHWTAKEAYLKALGCGVSGLGDIEVECSPSPALRWRGRPDTSRVLTMVAVSPLHAAAVVARQTTVWCRTWTWCS